MIQSSSGVVMGPQFLQTPPAHATPAAQRVQCAPRKPQPPPPVIRIESLTLQRGTKPLFENANAVVHPGEKAGLVGANGSG